MLLAATATLGVNPATAAALPGEWDVGQYDNCMVAVHDLVMAGDIPDNEQIEWEIQCCAMSGGVPVGMAECGAPAAVAAPNTPSAPPVSNADPDVGAGPGTGAGPRPTKKPPAAPTAPSGDNDDGSGSGSGGGQNDNPVG